MTELTAFNVCHSTPFAWEKQNVPELKRSKTFEVCLLQTEPVLGIVISGITRFQVLTSSAIHIPSRIGTSTWCRMPEALYKQYPVSRVVDANDRLTEGNDEDVILGYTISVNLCKIRMLAG